MLSGRRLRSGWLGGMQGCSLKSRACALMDAALGQVKHIRKEYGDYFGISVAGYPEGHPDRIKEVSSGSCARLETVFRRRVMAHVVAAWLVGLSESPAFSRSFMRVSERCFLSV